MAKLVWGPFHSLSILLWMTNGFNTLNPHITSAFLKCLKCFILYKLSACRSRWGPIVFTKVLLKNCCVLEGVFDSFNFGVAIHLFEILELYFFPEGTVIAEPKVVQFQLFLLSFYCVLETVLTLSKAEFSICLFEMPKMFYSPKGLQEENRRWSNCF